MLNNSYVFNSLILNKKNFNTVEEKIYSISLKAY